MTYQRDNFDPNLNNIHAAMAYNSAGEPVLRVLTYGSGGAMDLTAFHVETLPAADGGALIYDNTTGVFLFTPYSLATASNSILGGVKVDGSTITINDGVISAPYTYTLPKATANSLGGVEIGTNISVDPSTGKISVDLSSYATTSYVNGLKDRIVSPNDSYATYIDNTGTTYSAGDIIPGTVISNLGSVSQPWKDVYVSQGSIVIADTDVNVDGVSISNTAKYIVIDRGGLKVTSSIPGREIFQLDNTGKLLLKSEIPLATDSAAFEVIGSLLGTSLPIVNRGVMIHSSGAVDIPSRVYVDGVGTQTTAPYDSAYAAFIGRYARNTVLDPQPAEAGDIIVRFGGNAMADGLGLQPTSNVRIDMTATETQSDTGRGSRIEFWTTAIGSIVPERSVHLDSQGIDFSEATDINAGITFKNGSLLKYWPSITGNNGKILRTDGTSFFWGSETVPTGQVLFKGSWNASTNISPTLGSSLPAGVIAGWEYIVSIAGTQDIGNGSVAYGAGDLVIYDGDKWVRIPAAQTQIQADWTENNSALAAYIKHKPTLATIATTGSWNDLGDKPSIPAAQIPSDWTATSGIAKIINRPADTANDTANTLVLRDSVGGINAKDFTATFDASAASDHGPFNYGTLSYTDTGIMADFSYSTNSYNQIVLQNRSSGSAASANYIVSSNQGTANAYYGEFGMNSGSFSGSGSLSLPNAVYLNSISSDLVIGGTAVHFVIAGGADVVNIDSSGTATFANTITGSITGNSGTANKVNHAITFAATGGASAGATFDGSSAKTIDYHTVGAQVAGTYVTSVSGASPIGVTSGTTPQVSISQANSTTSGYLSSTDWTTFNNKSNTNGTVTSVTGNGVISVATGTTTPSISISQASGTTSGYLSSTDWTIFNNKTSNTGTVTSVAALTLTATGTDITSTVANSSTTPVITLNVPTASATNRGLLSSTDWTTFNNKSNTVGTVTSITASTTPVNGLSLSGGVITSTGTVAITGTLSGITNSNLSGTAGITNANLANSTISGVSLGNNLYNLTAGTGITFSSGTTYNGSAAITINNSITQYTDALARAAHSAGTGISYNSSTGVISSTITQYTDALAKASLSAGTGISYNSSTGVISSTITQYTDALARSAISVSGSLSYNSSTGVVSYTTPTYTVTTASASGGGALSLSGTTFTFTPASIPSYGVGGNQLVYELNASLSLTSAKNTLVSMFGLTSGVALQSNTRYHYELVFSLSSNKAGAISYALALGGGAVVAQHNFQWMANKTTTVDGYAAGIAMASFNATGAAITTAKDIAAFDNFTHVVIYGNIDVTTAGNVNFMLSQDQNTPITWTILAGAYVKLLPLGAIGANTVAGTWA